MYSLDDRLAVGIAHSSLENANFVAGAGGNHHERRSVRSRA